MDNINGYIIECHYDRESWDSFECVVARKDFDDGSFDILAVAGIPGKQASEPEIIAYAKHLCETRTDKDIIENHYKMLNSGKFWSETDKQNIERSYKLYLSGNHQDAINLLSHVEKPHYLTEVRLLASLLKHLQRISNNN